LALLTTIPQVNPVLAEEEFGTTLRLIEDHLPALAILDMSIPDVKEIIRQIKESCPQTHMIMLVNNVKEQEHAKELGADSVLLKGFPAQQLIDIVEKHIDRRGMNSLNSIDSEGGINGN
jgi:DNA-binding response OmpR family regulator